MKRLVLKVKQKASEIAVFLFQYHLGYHFKQNFYYSLWQKSFITCFEIALSKGYHVESPCLKPIMIQECVEYCQWHDEYVDKMNFEELLTLMKYGSPQRKWISDQVLEERAIASKLFGESNIADLKSKASSVPFSILCHREGSGLYLGEDIGLSKPVCNDFFPTPSDQGICMTENTNFKEIVHGHERYEVLLESKSQNPSSKIKGGTLWSQKTYVIVSFDKSVFLLL